MVHDTLGRRLRRLRLAREMKQERVARRAGISVSHLSTLEHDLRTPSLHTLVQLADVLGESVVEVLTGVPPYDRPEAAGRPRA